MNSDAETWRGLAIETKALAERTTEAVPRQLIMEIAERYAALAAYAARSEEANE
jgi:hypothetical protein